MVQALEDERNSIKTERDQLKASKRDDSDEINRLKLLISKLQRMLFGQKSEKLERQIDQLELELEDLYINQGEQAQIIEQAQANLSKAARKPRAHANRCPSTCHVKFKKYCLLKPIAQAAVATLYVWVKMSAKCWNMFPLTLKSSALFALS